MGRNNYDDHVEVALCLLPVGQGALEVVGGSVRAR